jgi:hypothetical protein
VHSPTHPRLQAWLDVNGALLDAAEHAVRLLTKKLTTKRRGPGALTRRPGPETPLWNALTAQLRAELQPYGAQARLARHLGLPRQRLRDFLAARSRMPDAELTLYLLFWLTEKRAGRDLSL